MIVWQTIAVAFAMFSAVPVPQPVWNQKNMRYALCAFPLVGAAFIWMDTPIPVMRWPAVPRRKKSRRF